MSNIKHYYWDEITISEPQEGLIDYSEYKVFEKKYDVSPENSDLIDDMPF